MLTPTEIYKLFLLKVNKNDTNANIKVPKSQFVILFNEQKRKWLDDKAAQKESSDLIEDIEELLEQDVELTIVSTYTRKDTFALPTNFYRRVESYSVASKDKCKNVIIYNWFIKPKNLNVLLQNSNYSPSFEWQETLVVLNNNLLSVYKDNFNIDEVFLTYYREPIDLDIAGYKKPNGSQSTDVNTDLKDKNIEEIVNRTATEALRNYESTEQLQIALQRQQQNEQHK